MSIKRLRYFEGYQSHYETDERGKKKRIFTYVGEKYAITGALSVKRIRQIVTIDILLLTAILLLINFFPGKIGMMRWVAIPCIWALVPLIFLYVGLFNFLTCGDKWMIRQYYAGYRRIANWSIPQLVLSAVVTVIHIILLIQNPDCFPGEIYYTLGALCCTILSAALVYIPRKYPAYVVEGPKAK